MQEENIVKSIIYGSPIQTSYGMFRALCSAINHKGLLNLIKTILTKLFSIFEATITSKNITNLSMLFASNRQPMKPSSLKRDCLPPRSLSKAIMMTLAYKEMVKSC